MGRIMNMRGYHALCLAALVGHSSSGLAQDASDVDAATARTTSTWSRGKLPDGRTPQTPAQRLSEISAIPLTSMTILGESARRFRYTNQEVTRYKLLDETTGESTAVAIDPHGIAQNYSTLEANEKAEVAHRFGTMSPMLHDRLSRDLRAQNVEVMLKLAVEEPQLDKSKLPSANLQQRASEHKRSVEVQAQIALERALLSADLLPSQLGAIEVDGPFVFAQVSAEHALRLARADKVVFVGHHDPESVLDATSTTSATVTEIDDGVDATWTDLVHSAGFKGNAVRVAIAEYSLPSGDMSCLPFVMGQQTDIGLPRAHLYKTLLTVSNNDHNYDGTCGGTRVGYAPDAELLVANGSGYIDQFTWAMNNGADVFSMSYHPPSEETDANLSARDLYFDYMATQYPYPVIVAAAGNQAATGAYASGKGYNFLGVGNIAFDNTLSNRCDNQIYHTSSWKNPNSTHGDREIPEIAMTGEMHKVSSLEFGGTSAATAALAASAALLIDAYSPLGGWPEAIRAILLASASHQLGDGELWSRLADGRDGVGLVNNYYANLIGAVRENGSTPQWRAYNYGSITETDFNHGVFDQHYYVPNTTWPIRVAFTWNSKTTSTSSSELGVDLDMRLYDKNNNLLQVSSSWDNNYELIDYQPTTASGPYRIEIHASSVPSSLFTYYGIAWMAYSDC